MSAIAIFLGGLLVLVAVAGGLMSVNPSAVLARALRYGLPVGLGAFAVTMIILGRSGIGIPLLAFAVALLARARNAARATRQPGGHSHVRSAALEMELDLDTGAMNGLVLAGSVTRGGNSTISTRRISCTCARSLPPTREPGLTGSVS
jgi:hypothetical protein